MFKSNEEKKIARITVSLKPVEHEALAKLAEQRDVSLSWIVRKAVEQYIAINLEQDQLKLDLMETHHSLIK